METVLFISAILFLSASSAESQSPVYGFVVEEDNLKPEDTRDDSSWSGFTSMNIEHEIHRPGLLHWRIYIPDLDVVATIGSILHESVPSAILRESGRQGSNGGDFDENLSHSQTGIADADRRIWAGIRGRKLLKAPSPVKTTEKASSPLSKKIEDPDKGHVATINSVSKLGIFRKKLKGKSKTALLNVAIESLIEDDSLVLEAALLESLQVNAIYRNNSDVRGKLNDTLLHWAARFNADECAEVLIHYGADVEKRNVLGETPLHHSCDFASLDAAEVLVDNDAEVDSLDDEGQTCLHEVSRVGDVMVIKFLLKNNASLVAKDKRGLMPLHEAVRFGHLEAVKVLIASGAKINAPDNKKVTPLHYAARYNKVQIAKLLLSKGASKTAKDGLGNMPFQASCKYTSCTAKEESAIATLLKP